MYESGSDSLLDSFLILLLMFRLYLSFYITFLCLIISCTSHISINSVRVIKCFPSITCLLWFNEYFLYSNTDFWSAFSCSRMMFHAWRHLCNHMISWINFFAGIGRNLLESRRAFKATLILYCIEICRRISENFIEGSQEILRCRRPTLWFWWRWCDMMKDLY